MSILLRSIPIRSLSTFPLPPKPPSNPNILKQTHEQGTSYGTIVIGGGHAGCEALSSSSTLTSTLCITQKLSQVGELSCNPSIGGIGKGHLVREIDALDGVMGKAADLGCCHFRMLNERKGTAVRGPRGQMDRDLYKSAVQSILSEKCNLDFLEGAVEDLIIDFDVNGEKVVKGVVTNTGEQILADAVVVTTGTFLGGTLMCGLERYSGGRHLRDSEAVEPPSNALSKTFRGLNFDVGRLKTGTPPRLNGDTIDYDLLEKQGSDSEPIGFDHVRQFNGLRLPNEKDFITCYKTATNEETHRLCLEYEHLLPRYDGAEGDGMGPRYCPSIYKKVQRFPERTGHNCFLEPEGINTNIVYPNGMSGPYPPEIQQKIINSMYGLSETEIIVPGYDVEYDFINPIGLKHTLETKDVGGLYLAGQICGTTGYEEAAAQGVVAGANAGLKSKGDEREFIVGRDEGYIGVLVDDLVTKGVTEPYRMFTSRSEYRLSLRADNADLRLTRKGVEYGIVTDDERVEALEERKREVERGVEALEKFRLFVSEWSEKGGDKMGGTFSSSKKKSSVKKSAHEVLRMPHVTLGDIENIMKSEDDKFQSVSLNSHDTVEATVKYSAYLHRQEKDMDSWRKAQGLLIPPDIVYDRTNFPTLKEEELQLLKKFRPGTLGDANSIQGITPQGLVYLQQFVRKRGRKRDRNRASQI
ncbi:hypothetical protein TrVE_jg10377 [Triparma verrucosa]|uniref:tRNA uridine 5-carboxymethylaminomethyl modification enzyme C-terminal subdomain domain-containing protein n=1 Tax=Triparma verrucosa TaxID=1606542 RepID=A0A9W7FI04_9STRA|nr:hypothetical protein TrVE_jg10377 [Triparma verrucosa]